MLRFVPDSHLICCERAAAPSFLSLINADDGEHLPNTVMWLRNRYQRTDCGNYFGSSSPDSLSLAYRSYLLTTGSLLGLLSLLPFTLTGLRSLCVAATVGLIPASSCQSNLSFRWRAAARLPLYLLTNCNCQIFLCIRRFVI